MIFGKALGLTIASAALMLPATGLAQSIATEKLSQAALPVSGVAKDASGNPVSGASILLHLVEGCVDLTATSHIDGAFIVTGAIPGRYQVFASKDGFLSSPEFVTLSQGQANRVEVSLQAQNTSLNTAILEGMAAMQKRIEQLETELHRTRPTDAPAASTATATALPLHSPDSPQLPLIASNGTYPALGIPAVSKEPALPLPLAKASTSSAVPQPESPQAPPEKKAPIDPFSDADWSWLNGNSRQKDSPLDTKYFTGEFRADAYYGVDFNQPRDHTMGGSSEVFRSGEVQLEDLSIGGDFHVDNVRGRVLLLNGLFAATTPRNDASSAVGQWDVRGAYKYVSEAWGGYHWNVNHGLNVDAGIFVSYVGLFSYHNFDNWAYQPSYVSSNTPWFFNGVRVQWFPTAHLKIEPWFVNGWQSYNKFNSHPGFGGQIKWSPKPWLMVIGNQYGFGEDTLGNQRRQRYHTDDSIEVKYYDRPNNTIDKAAFTFTGDLGCESGGGVTCHGGKAGPKQAFLGYMVYNRVWFKKDLYAITLGGGQISNPGRYLTLVLPVNGADAVSGTPYFPQNPGSQFKAYDATATFDYMPKQYFTWRMEFGYRHANVPYFSGRGGSTPPLGNNGVPSQYVCNDGAPSATTTGCGADGGLWSPDLRRGQALLMMAFLIKF